MSQTQISPPLTSSRPPPTPTSTDSQPSKSGARPPSPPSRDLDRTTTLPPPVAQPRSPATQVSRSPRSLHPRRRRFGSVGFPHLDIWHDAGVFPRVCPSVPSGPVAMRGDLCGCYHFPARSDQLGPDQGSPHQAGQMQTKPRHGQALIACLVLSTCGSGPGRGG